MYITWAPISRLMKQQQKHSFGLMVVAVCGVVLAAASGCVWDVGGEAPFAGNEAATDAKAIVGGSATTIAAHPWQVSVQTSSGYHFCGGSILNDTWVLTANHCVEGSTASSLRVVAGVTKLSQASQGQVRGVAQIVRFPGYSSPELGKDAALLRLSTPLALSGTVTPIAFATPDDVAAGATDAGRAATVSGWGATSSGSSSTPDTLRAATLALVSATAAQAAYAQESLTADQLAAAAAGRDSCQGDSGGPLTVSSSRGPLLVGIVSWGYGCADPAWPGLYGRVSAFASWIASTTGIAGGTGSDPVAPPIASVTLLDKDGLSGASGTFQHFAITVPEGASSLEVTIAGGNGDADLYVRKRYRPTTSRFDCRPYTDTSNEVCTLATPGAGTWYVSVRAWATYSGLRLVAVAR